MYNIQRIRQDFPILNRVINGHPLAYLDNGATTQKPKQVIDAIVEYYTHHNANVNRGIHTLAEESTEAYEQSRRVVAQFIKAREDEVIFVRNTTEALNLLVFTWGWAHLKAGDEVILSQLEHHANIVPWQMLAQRTGAVLKFIELTPEGELSLDSLKSLLSEKTKVVSFAHVSNVLGTINPVKEMVKQVKHYNKNILCVVDGAQSVPHMQVSVKDLGVDFLAFSGHKVCGPMGIGVLWGKREHLETMQPFLGGGDMISAVYWDYSEYNKVPERFEAGTPNVAGAVGLAAAITYLTHVGLDNIAQHEHKLTNYLVSRLEEFPEIRILGPKESKKRSGLVAFEMEGIHAHDVAQVLNALGVAVRSGHHCAMPLHNLLKCSASTRASMYLYNTQEEIDRLIDGLVKAKQVFDLR